MFIYFILKDLRLNILIEIVLNFYDSKATHVRNAWKNYFFLVDLEFDKFKGFNKNQRQKMSLTNKKSFFQHF